MSSSESKVWIGFSRFQVPTAIARDGVLIGGPEAVLLLVLFRLANTPEPKDPVVTVRVGVPRLISLTGLADKTVRLALGRLEAHRLIDISPSRKKNRSRFGCNAYVLLNPKTGDPLKAEAGRGVCHLNDVQYFPVPTDVVKGGILARLASSEKSLYIALLIITGRNQSVTFTAATPMLTKLCGLSTKTFRKAVEGLELRGLIIRDGKTYTICDPITRERPTRTAAVSNPRNWTTEDKKALDYDTLTAQQWKLVIDECFRHPYVYAEEGWTALTKCPYHSGDGKHTLSFNFERGCFKCHHKKCTAKGKLSRFVKALRKTNEQETQEFIARCVGVELRFNRPTKDAIKIWRYFNDNYGLVKEVFLFADGDITERAIGRGLLLYHLPEVRACRTVLVLRNEADCDQMDEIKLKDADGSPVVTTTGGYLTGWLPKFAAELGGKNVVVMYVSDAGGIRFYKDVADSLDECDIPHRHVSVKKEEPFSVEELKERIGSDWLYSEVQTSDSEYGAIEL